MYRYIHTYIHTISVFLLEPVLRVLHPVPSHHFQRNDTITVLHPMSAPIQCLHPSNVTNGIKRERENIQKKTTKEKSDEK